MSTLVKTALSSMAIGDSRVFVQNMLNLVSHIKCRHSNVVKGKEVIILLKRDISGLPVEVLHHFKNDACTFI